MYKLVVNNGEGSDSVDIEVTVVSSPSQPVGPLTVQDVTGSSCHIMWKVPTDDGGDSISHYLMEKKDSRNNIWQSIGKCLTTHMDITDLQLGLDYLFRVKAVNGEGESAGLQTGDMITAKDPFRAPSAPTNIRSTEVGSRWVKLAWNKPSSDGGANINNYIIERRDPLTKTFIKVTETLT